MKTPEERIAELESTVAILLSFLNPTADAITMTLRRLQALEAILTDKHIVTDAEITANMQAIDDAATLEAEYSPEFEEWRRVRDILRRQTENQRTEEA
jgi:hypothetical protein